MGATLKATNTKERLNDHDHAGKQKSQPCLFQKGSIPKPYAQQLPADFNQQKSYKEPELVQACEISHPFDRKKRTHLESFAFLSNHS